MTDIVGVELLTRLLPLERGTGTPLHTYRYEDWLDGAVLPYISRDNYIQTHPGVANLTSEAELLERLITSVRHGGLMIYGDGGIGKTRLMLEISLMAEKKGWVAYHITPQLHDLTICCSSTPSKIIPCLPVTSSIKWSKLPRTFP
jgi:hypothetical protein